MKIRTLIVDDMRLARDRLVRHLETDAAVEIIGQCAGGQEAIDAIRELKPDLLFLDVQMPGVDGFDVLAAVGPDAVPAIIFVTAYDQFALKAFEVNALDYLLKPYDGERLAAAVAKAKRQLTAGRGSAVDERLVSLLRSIASRPRPSARLAFKVDGRTVLLTADEIDFVEAAGNYVRIVAGSESHLVRERLGAMEEALDPALFVRVHRSTIVNISQIKEMRPLYNGDQTLVLRGGAKLTMSRTFRDRLMTRIGRSARDAGG